VDPEGEDYPGQLNERRRNDAVKDAVAAADIIILNTSDGSVEETDYLTARVAEEFVRKALGPFSSTMLRKDLENRHRTLLEDEP